MENGWYYTTIKDDSSLVGPFPTAAEAEVAFFNYLGEYQD